MSHSSSSAGMPPGRRPSRRSRTHGLRPARVVAVHRETSIVRDDGRRPAGGGLRARSGSPRSPTSDFPAVGDWVVARATGRTRSSARSCRAGASSSGWPPTRPAPRDALDDEQIMAANVDVAFLVAGPRQRLQPAPHRALPRGRLVERRHARSSSSTRRTSPTTSTAGWSRSTRSRRASPAVAVSARTGAGLDELRAPSPAGRDRGDPRLVGRRQVDARQRPARRGRARRPARSATPTRAAATRRPTASCSSCPAAPSWSTRPASGRSRSLGADEGVEVGVRRRRRHRGDVPLQRLPPRRASPAAPSAPPSPTAGSARNGWPATASSSASSPAPPARPTRGPGPSTAATGRSSTSRSTQHMQRKYGGER